MQQAANQQFNQDRGGLLNMGTFYNAQDAERGDLKTAGLKKIGGGVLQTAATIAPFAKGGTVAIMAGKLPIVKAAPCLPVRVQLMAVRSAPVVNCKTQAALILDRLPEMRGVKNTTQAGIQQFRNGNQIGAVGDDVAKQSTQKIQAADRAYR
jgi:hypothetical protein